MISMSPESISRAYNNRLLVPHFQDILRLWDERSAQARDGLASTGRAHWNLPYGPRPLNTLDLIQAEPDAQEVADRRKTAQPRTRPAAPILFFIHGGYWRMLDKSAQTFIVPTWSARGAMVVIPNYSLAPAVTLADISLEVVQALAWVWRNAKRFGGDPQRIVVAGHSAGGHLTGMALSCLWPQLAPDLPPRMVTRGMAISGLFDLDPLQHCEWLQPDIKLNGDRIAAWSPARWKAPAGCEAVAVAGELESSEFHRQAALWRQAWGPKAVRAVESAPGRNHFDILFDLLDPQTVMYQHLERLLGLPKDGH